jgi:hypothetical protein
MYKQFKSTTEQVQATIKALQQLQFLKKRLDKQHVPQFNTFFVLVASVPDSEVQNFLYVTFYGNDCCLKGKTENDEEQNFNGNRRCKSNIYNYYNNNNNNNNHNNNSNSNNNNNSNNDNNNVVRRKEYNNTSAF